MEYAVYLETINKVVKKGFFLAECRLASEPQKDIGRLEEEIRQIRQTLSMENQKFEISRLMSVLDCTEFERHVFYLFFCCEVHPACRMAADMILHKIGKSTDCFSYEMAVLTYENPQTIAGAYQAFQKGGKLWNWICRFKGEHAFMSRRLTTLFLTNELDVAFYGIPLRIFHCGGKTLQHVEKTEHLDKLCALCRNKQKKPETKIIWIQGEPGVGKRTLLCQLACEMECPVVLLEESEISMEDRIVFLEQEACLRGGIPALFVRGEEHLSALHIQNMHRKLFLVVSDQLPEKRWQEEFSVFQVGELSLKEQEKLWKAIGRSYSLAKEVSLEEIAGRFQMTPQKIVSAYQYAQEMGVMKGASQITSDMLFKSCQKVLKSDLGSHAQKVHCTYRWEDLVLPDRCMQSLRDACNQVVYRKKVFEDWGMNQKLPYGTSVSMVFAGLPGTGKTMAAQVIANSLQMELYRVDLSTIVSKYIGETEKNLNEIFEKAQKSQVILFFDEADVLFSKRTEVREANDKYSNMEAAFLLQKMESYTGVVILATNYFQNFDDAFKRRIKLLVEFPFPDAKNRKKIWEKTIPKDLPVDELDFDFLSEKYELSGSNIRNIVLHAAFLAAGEDVLLGMEHMLRAIANEYQKLGKTFTEKDAQEYYWLL